MSPKYHVSTHQATLCLDTFSGLGYLEGRSFQQTVEDARSNFWSLYKVKYCIHLWFIRLLINVDLGHHVLFLT